MTSATERLRALLDERGVEWRPIAWNPKRETFYHTSDGVGFCADEYVDGVKIYTDAIISPEQAVAATLGRGECRLIPTRDKPRSKALTLTCSKCGWWTDRINDRINYCPMCGRRIVGD